MLLREMVWGKDYNPNQPRDEAGRWSEAGLTEIFGDLFVARHSRLFSSDSSRLLQEVSQWDDLRREIAEVAATADRGTTLEFSDKGELVGIANVIFEREKGKNYLRVVVLATKRPGYGRRAFDTFFSLARSRKAGIILESLEDANGFYEKLGMHKIREEGDYKTFSFLPGEVSAHKDMNNLLGEDEPFTGIFAITRSAWESIKRIYPNKKTRGIEKDTCPLSHDSSGRSCPNCGAIRGVSLVQRGMPLLGLVRWECLRAKSLREMMWGKDYDPAQPRDGAGRWSEEGGNRSIPVKMDERILLRNLRNAGYLPVPIQEANWISPSGIGVNTPGHIAGAWAAGLKDPRGRFVWGEDILKLERLGWIRKAPGNSFSIWELTESNESVLNKLIVSDRDNFGNFYLDVDGDKRSYTFSRQDVIQSGGIRQYLSMSVKSLFPCWDAMRWECLRAKALAGAEWGKSFEGHAGRPGKVGGSLPRQGGIKRGVEGDEISAVVSKPTTEYARVRAREVTRQVNNQGSFTPASEEQIERVASLLSQHDEKVVRAVRGIRIASGSIAFAGEFARAGAQGPSIRTAAFWNKKYDSITLRLNYKDVTFHHEVGHAAWQNSYKKGIWAKSHGEDPKFDRHTSYSKTDMEEAFCESYSSWVSSGGRADSPKYQRTFDAVSGVVNGIP